MSSEIDAQAFPLATPSEHLSGRLGVLRIVSLVIAFSAPLAVVSGYLAVEMALGDGLGAPGAFVVVGLLLLLFSVGYTELVKALPITGGFYVYITAGLGRPLGLASTLLALLSYSFLAAGTYAFLGLTASRFVADYIGVSVPWWAFVGAAWLLSVALSYRDLSASAKILGVTITLEFILIFAFEAAVLVRGGAEGFSWAPFSLSQILSGSTGLALLFGVSVVMGFESTAVYRDEARIPGKTIPRATFLAVAVLAVFYSSATYFLITSLGVSHALGIAVADPARAFPDALNRELGSLARGAGYLLLCESLYGAVLAMHNVLARYCFRLARSGLIHRRLAAVHPTFRSPSTAALWSGPGILLLMVPLALLGVSPNLLYARLVGIGTFGLIVLFFLTSISVIAYFLRAKVRPHAVRSILVPSIAALGLFVVFALANRNFVVLVGTSETAALCILASIYAIGLVGLGWALWLRGHKPHVYAGIGQD